MSSIGSTVVTILNFLTLDWILFGLRLFATIILYSFLGLALHLIWRELTLSAEQVVTEAQRRPRLRVVSAAEPDLFRVGDIVPLEPVTVMGSYENNQIVLADLAPRQARILHENGVWWLERLSEGSPVQLNDNPITQPTVINADDRITLGQVEFKFEAM